MPAVSPVEGMASVLGGPALLVLAKVPQEAARLPGSHPWDFGICITTWASVPLLDTLPTRSSVQNLLSTACGGAAVSLGDLGSSFSTTP